MKFLVHGNAPHVKTGYGVQVAQLVERLQRSGHEVAVSSTYGQQGGAGTWVVPATQEPVVVYPCGYEVNGNDVIHGHAQHMFGGDVTGGWIITCLDVWSLQNPVLADFQVAAWCPVDHFPAPKGVVEFFKRTDAVPVAMSRFGERLLFDAGLDPVYVPLSVDTRVYKPSPSLTLGDGRELSARAVLGIPEDAFVVGMVAMNKGWARDRKGFNEAFRAFGAFWRNHPDAVLYLHSEKFGGAEGINLVELAQHCAIPEHAIIWADQYAYRLGAPAEVMACTYSAFDVLLSPSHGEGFCVPLIESQACGTPVIANDFSAQPELVGSGWLLQGQPEWDPAQHASYVVPLIDDVVAKLEAAYATDGATRADLSAKAVAFAQQYDSDRVFVEHWIPFLETLEPAARELPSYDRSPIPEAGGVAVIVPAMRVENMARLRTSFLDTTNGGADARLVVVADVGSPVAEAHADVIIDGPSTFAQKVNLGFSKTSEPWVLLVGDDCEFKPGWLEAARKLSGEFDVIGTNDSEPGRVRNPDVAAGRHADHFFVRRSYVDSEGACLDGAGVLAPEAYQHWFVDKEIIGLAKARGVFAPCLDSVVVHHHPGYDGREDLRAADATYMKAVESSEADAKAWRSRVPLIEMQRTSRAK